MVLSAIFIVASSCDVAALVVRLGCPMMAVVTLSSLRECSLLGGSIWRVAHQCSGVSLVWEVVSSVAGVAWVLTSTVVGQVLFGCWHWWW